MAISTERLAEMYAELTTGKIAPDAIDLARQMLIESLAPRLLHMLKYVQHMQADGWLPLRLVTSTEVAAFFDVGPTQASTDLKTLADYGLLCRVCVQGNEFLYHLPQEEIDYCYAAFKPCGCMVGAAVELQSMCATLAEWGDNSIFVRRVPVTHVRAGLVFGDCPHETKQERLL